MDTCLFYGKPHPVKPRTHALSLLLVNAKLNGTVEHIDLTTAAVESSAPIIALSNVTKHYGSIDTRPALRNINLHFYAREYVAIVGKSGSGKSTLLNMLTGIDHPTDGTVTINSTELNTLSESALAAWRGKNIGIVFQFFQLIPTLTVAENLLLAMDLVNVIPKDRRKLRTNTLLESVGIAQHGHKLPSTLSGGEQQRAAIARALANDPPIIVADEPTGNLDTQTASLVQDLLKSLVTNGKTVIVVTHDITIRSHFDRVIEVSDGVAQQ